MGLFGWKPTEGKRYAYKRWHRRKNLVWRQSGVQGVGIKGMVPVGTRSQNISKVYIVLDGIKTHGAFKIAEGVCTIKIAHHKASYSTDAENVKFSRKESISRIHPRFGKTTNINHYYMYTAEILDSAKLTKEDAAEERRRGTAIVDTEKGVLVVAEKNKSFVLPGGGARRGESREKAAIRELREETGLKSTSARYLFSIKGGVWKGSKGKHFKNDHKVFLIEATGKARPDGREIRHIGYWKPGSKLKIGKTSKAAIERYLKEFK